jgi:hypothetical protein
MGSSVEKVKQLELELLQRKIKLVEGLPHIYGFRWYRWAYEYFTSTNRMCFLTAGNQLSKSSSQIRKCIDWAIDKSRWDELFPKRISDPNVFWYFYPTADVATEEFELKWSLFLPKGEMKDDPVYGWKAHYKNGKIYCIDFKSGVTIIFKTYAQSVTDIQTGTVFCIFLDEECPLSHWPEIQARLNATDGYLSMVFTATLGQEQWRKTLEGKGSDELYPTADKWQVTLFDCLEYIDGSESPWSFEKVRRAVARACSDPTNQAAVEACVDLVSLKKLALTVQDPEVQRRILGKFVMAGGRKFDSFRRDLNVCVEHPIPSDWLWFGGADYGGGGSGHPSACVFVAVSPDYTVGRVVKGRRADGVTTTAKDLLDIYREVRGNTRMTLQVYDYHCKDFHTFATRAGESFIKAEKDQNWGTTTMNTLFKLRALQIFDEDVELEKLITELVSLQMETPKNVAKDDFCDALRYTVMSIPWNWEALDAKEIDLELRKKEPVKKPQPTQEDERRDFVLGRGRDEEYNYTAEDECSDWDGLINEFDS